MLGHSPSGVAGNGIGFWIGLCCAGLIIAPLQLPAAALGTAFSYQGQLTESGQPASGLYDLQVCLFDSLVNPVQIACAADANDVPVESGLFAISIDFGAGAFAGQERYLELRVRAGASTGAYTALSPRQLIRAAPEAQHAAVANVAPWSGVSGVPAGFADGIDNDSGGSVTSIAAGAGLTGGVITGSGTLAVDTTLIQSRVSGNCVAGQYVRQVNADGTVVCGTDANSGGTVTSVGSGAGLTGGPISGSGTIAIANGGVGLAQINVAQVQARVSGSCPLGSYLRGINADGSVICVDVPGANSITTVDDPGDYVGDFTSIAVPADGLPIIVYRDDTNTALSLWAAKCSNARCTGPSTLSIIEDGVDAAGQYTSVAIGADGLPIVSYYADGLEVLKVAKCVDAACASPAIITTVDATIGVGTFTSLAIGNDGIPVISYVDETGVGALKVARCANANCTGAATITTVDATASVGYFSSIAIGADGFPVIGYLDGSAGSLKVAKCSNMACSGAATLTTVDNSANDVGAFSALAIGSDGIPVIAYQDATANTVKVAKCANPACTGASTITVVDDPANSVGEYLDLAIGSDGFPVLTYRDDTVGALKTAKCNNAACTGASLITVLDDPSGTNGGWYGSIAIGTDGLPVISYQGVGGTLKVAKCGTRSCQ